MSNKIDSLVAEKVMGWRAYTRVRDDFTILHQDVGDEIANPSRCSGLFRRSTRTNISYYACRIPDYSTDIAAAWAVVQHMRSNDWWWEIRSRSGKNGTWTVTMDHASDPDGTRLSIHDHKSECMAICIAALKAVGVPEQQIQEAKP